MVLQVRCKGTEFGQLFPVKQGVFAYAFSSRTSFDYHAAVFRAHPDLFVCDFLGALFADFCQNRPMLYNK